MSPKGVDRGIKAVYNETYGYKNQKEYKN